MGNPATGGQTIAHHEFRKTFHVGSEVIAPARFVVSREGYDLDYAEFLILTGPGEGTRKWSEAFVPATVAAGVVAVVGLIEGGGELLKGQWVLFFVCVLVLCVLHWLRNKWPGRKQKLLARMTEHFEQSPKHSAAYRIEDREVEDSEGI